MENEKVETMFQDMEYVTPQVVPHDLSYRHSPRSFSDRFAKTTVHASARAADFLFKSRYGHRAVVLETIAAVPGMVGGLFQHLRSLRFIKDDRGWIRALLDEAENERMHLLIYSQLARPDTFERFAIIIIQFFFYAFYFILYLVSPKTAHRVVGYFEEEAINSYRHFLSLVEEGLHENTAATDLAISYWGLSQDARLKEIIEATIKDEMLHRDVNHKFASDAVNTRFWH